MRKWLFLCLCVLLMGCSVRSEPQINPLELNREQLMEHYDVTLYPGNPRVVEGYVEQKETESGMIDVVTTWESDPNSVVELHLPENVQIEEVKIYCLVVDMTTTCDCMDDAIVYYWLVPEK